MARLLVRGGTLIDGSGAAPRRADLLIEGDRVADMPAPAGAQVADAEIDASGLVVCPGFIDIHSHGDLIFTLPLEDQRQLMAGRIAQGITTEIVGNCGLGVYPCSAESVGVLRAVVGWMTPPAASGWPDADGGGWTDLGSYLALLEAKGTCVNVGALQPHGPLRIQAAGLSPSVPAAAAGRMARDLEAALDAGAFGLSVGLIYPPGIFTATDEIVDLARIVSGRCGDNAFVAGHVRGSSETLLPAVEELLQVGRESGVRVQHSHSEAVGRDHWHKIDQVLSMEEAARSSGVAVSFDMFPYTAAATMMLAIYPPWALEGGVDRLLARLSDAAVRLEIKRDIDSLAPSWPPWGERGWPHNLVRAVGWERIVIGSVAMKAHRNLEGLSLAELGERRRRQPFDAISDLMIEEGGMVSQIIHGISGEQGSEQGIETLLRHPAGAVCTDANDFGKGRPHPAAYGAYPRVLGEFVRVRGLLTLPEAIHKMTGLPASLLGLADRGALRPGAFADLVILDPATVGSDASFEDPRRLASGIRWVLINGGVAHGPDASHRRHRARGMVLRRSS